eukprot:Sro570_g168580.1 n/a (261) ;mRNA; r:50132-50914
MAPPSKDGWAHGGALYKTFSVPLLTSSPPIRSFQPPAATHGMTSLSHYEQVFAFGDSAMKQFVKNASRVLEPNIVFRTKRRKPWTTALIQEHLTVFRKQLGRDLAGRNSNKSALLLGSSIWDVLASNTDKAQNNQNNNLLFTKNQPVFQDHLTACRQFIGTVRQEYPHVQVLWKSPSAMHVHVVVANNNDTALQNRVRYMSSSRMAHLYRLQRQLMQELQVPFLDIYEATYLSADWTFPGDGRHYLPELHKHMLKWFYTT